MTCANNCRGVNPNSVIIGGGAVLAAATVGGLGYLAPVGVVGAAAAGGTAALMASMRCPRTRPCRVRIDNGLLLKFQGPFSSRRHLVIDFSLCEFCIHACTMYIVHVCICTYVHIHMYEFCIWKHKSDILIACSVPAEGTQLCCGAALLAASVLIMTFSDAQGAASLELKYRNVTYVQCK